MSRRDDEIDPSGMPVGVFASSRMLGEHVSALDLKALADAVNHVKIVYL
jgi:hypothetical protein